MVSTAVDASAVARVLGIKTTFVNLRGGIAFLPQRIALVGQGATGAVYAATKQQVFSALEAGQTYGFGSPIHLATKELLPANGDGVGTIPVTVYPLTDQGGGSAASAGDITPAGVVTKAGAFRVLINNIPSAEFSVAIGDTVAAMTAKITTAILANLDMPMVPTDNSTDVGLLAKWHGTSGNGLVVEVTGPTDTGVSFGITQPVGGLINPDISAAGQDPLAQVGNVWETLFLNCLEVADTSALDEYESFIEGRWGPLVRRPAVAFAGNTEVDPVTAITVTDARKTDRSNCQLVAPGSNDLPFVVAARQLARIASRANNNPPFDYGSLPADGLTPGDDGDQWTYPQRDAAVKGGSSTVEVKDGVIEISDVVTMYHPTGDPTPAYRYVVDIIKIMQVIFNLDLIYAADEWNGAPLIPDDQPTANPAAKKPKMATAATAQMIDSLALNAILSAPEAAKATIVSAISSTNPKRLDQTFTGQLSGNTNIISEDFNFGFFFGTPAIVA